MSNTVGRSDHSRTPVTLSPAVPAQFPGGGQVALAGGARGSPSRLIDSPDRSELIHLLNQLRSIYMPATATRNIRKGVLQNRTNYRYASQGRNELGHNVIMNIQGLTGNPPYSIPRYSSRPTTASLTRS
jgi:hypothetical protein